MIQAIFFDFNGVVINDEPLQLKAYQQALAEQGITLTEKQYYSALGMDDRMFVRTAFGRSAKTLNDKIMLAVIEQKSDLHRELIKDEVPLFPGVVTLLKAASRRYSLGLVSMARRKEIDYVLDQARLSALFCVIVSAEDVANCKPAPDCYQRALETLNEKRREARKLRLLPRECLVIEDAPPGIQAGRAAGMQTLGLTNTVSEADLRAAGAEMVSASLADWTVDAVRRLY